jgi:hypothetical protein
MAVAGTGESAGSLGRREARRRGMRSSVRREALTAGTVGRSIGTAPVAGGGRPPQGAGEDDDHAALGGYT